VDTRSLLPEKKNYLTFSQIVDVMMLNDAYLVGCFHWSVPCCRQHIEVFLFVLQDKRKPQIIVFVVYMQDIFLSLSFSTADLCVGCNIIFLFASTL